MAVDILYPLRKVHGKIHEHKAYKAALEDFKTRFILPNKDKLRRKKCVFLLLTPQHTNLGDHAIAQAEINILNKLGIEYIEITGSQLLWLSDPSVMKLMNGCPILINGGGNLGTLWPEVENLHRNIVRYNPQSPIYILPNTIFYEDNDHGREELAKSVEIYNAHPRLRFYARETTSYEFMKQHYRDVCLVPDMVLSLGSQLSSLPRSGCRLLLRNDLEKTRSEADERVIFEQVKRLFGENYIYTDMHAEQDVMPKERETALKAKFEEFCSAELIITDRLHAMIFSAITHTPCIVINSKSPKVKGCYEWIKHLGYVRIVDDAKDIETTYLAVQNRICQFQNDKLIPYFNDLCVDLQDLI